MNNVIKPMKYAYSRIFSWELHIVVILPMLFSKNILLNGEIFLL